MFVTELSDLDLYWLHFHQCCGLLNSNRNFPSSSAYSVPRMLLQQVSLKLPKLSLYQLQRLLNHMTRQYYRNYPILATQTCLSYFSKYSTPTSKRKKNVYFSLKFVEASVYIYVTLKQGDMGEA